MENIYKRLNAVFADIFDDDSIEVGYMTTAADVEDWDSLNHISLIEAVENEFGVSFTMGEVSGMKNVGEMVAIIEKRGTKI